MSSDRLWNAQYLKTLVANFAIFFSFWLILPLLPIYLSEEYLASKDVIGMILSGYTWMAMFSRAVSGWMVDSLPRKLVLNVSWLLFSLFFAGYLVTGSLLLFGIIRTLHGGPFGTVTVSNSTVAIDVLPPSRRAEGIGYYGLSNNLATALAPTIGLWMYSQWHDYQLIFCCSMAVAFIGFFIDATVRLPKVVSPAASRRPHSLRSLFLLNGWSEGLDQAFYSMAYSIVSTYIAIYGKEELGITSGTGVFFTVLSVSLVVSRLTGSKGLRGGRETHNCALGIVISAIGYLCFATLHNYVGYYACAVLVGFGNGRMFPAIQTMFINLAGDARRGVANSTHLTSWDVGQGIGVIAGGAMVHLWGYGAAFWLSFFSQAMGVLFFFCYVRHSYLRHLSRS